ncbi:mammalian cell entry protein [Mycolicibacterium parafortuitum]|uniref:Mammalian cell entry protein n=2 Tax=Mycolicibacterium parafortuitum TaxID=39692 RepID=A0A7I7TYT9_MYCPF|nr:mammalian cell entry protein [Mycolicibacterium parafortuitum]
MGKAARKVRSAGEPSESVVAEVEETEPADESSLPDETAGVREPAAEPTAETAVDPEGEAERGEEADPATEAQSEPASETDETAEVAAGPEAEPVVLVPHRPASRRALIATAVASVVFVGSAGFAAAMAQPYLSERALVQTKLNIARTATDAITTLWTYTPDDMVTLADRASVFLYGGFADEYRRYIDAIVEPNKQAQVTNTTQVMGAAVESVSPPGIPNEATAIVYTNSVATSPVTKNIPSLRYLSYRLTMKRDGSDWRITRMSTITSFDLTPQL